MPIRLTSAAFIEKAIQKHGDRYIYTGTVYKNYLTDVAIVCKKHGEFAQKPNNHLFGAGCPVCAMSVKTEKLSDDRESFVKKSEEKLGNKYTYERVDYVNSKTPVIVTCSQHGHFKVRPNALLTGHAECSACSGSKLNAAAFAARSKLIHGDRYDYSKSRVAGYHAIVTITCKEHGDFEQTPNNHFQGKGCPKCIGRLMSDTASFITAAKLIHGDTYDYSEVEYVSAVKKVKIGCPKHGLFEQQPNNHTRGNGCSKCSSKVSKPEIELFEMIRSFFPNAMQSVWTIIAPLQLDIVVPDKKIAIEFNGLHYHSDRNDGKRDDYHFEKMKKTEEAGYRLIQVWEDDWKNKRTVVVKTLRHALGLSDKAEQARKCTVTLPALKNVVQFFTTNHLQGCPRQGVVYALEYEGRVIAAMAFHRVVSERGMAASANRWELGRYATTQAVAGGASRLFRAFLKDHAECAEVISYSDNDWFDGKMYTMLGFRLGGIVKPDYKIVDGGLRRHKTNYKLSELQKRLGEKFDPLLTERENCRNNGLFRVYGSGLKKWIWTPE